MAASYRPLAVLLPMIPGIACQPPSDGDFRIIAVDFDGAYTLTLTFSRPIANVGEVDPEDFRLSYGKTWRNESEADSYSYYGDINQFGSYAETMDQPFRFVSVALGEAPDQLVLMSSDLVPADSPCEYIAYYLSFFEAYFGPDSGIDLEMGMFVHYAAGDIPITSDDGQTLADIGPDWVLTEERWTTLDVYGFPKLVPRIQIPCS